MKVYYETTVPANIVKDKIKRKYGEYLQEILSKKLFPEFVKPRKNLTDLIIITTHTQRRKPFPRV